MTAVDPTPVAAVRPAASPPPPDRGAAVVWQQEMIRFGRDRSRIILLAVQPVLFLFVLGTKAVVADRLQRRHRLRTFLFPGVLATSVLFTAAFSGISMVWDREFGFLQEMLVAPSAPPPSSPASAWAGPPWPPSRLIILALALWSRVPYSLVMMVKLVELLFLMAFMICALGLFLSARVKQVQSAMPLVQLTITPLMFLSESLFPLSNLPGWLHVATILNPMTYLEPIRSTVFDHLDLSSAARTTFDPGITLGRLAESRCRSSGDRGRHLPGPARPGRSPFRPDQVAAPSDCWWRRARAAAASRRGSSAAAGRPGCRQHPDKPADSVCRRG